MGRQAEVIPEVDFSSVFSFHSISFPNEWGEKVLVKTGMRLAILSFHSISFPNEWGVDAIGLYLVDRKTFPFN